MIIYSIININNHLIYLVYLLDRAKESNTKIMNIPKNKYNINSSVI